VHNSVRVQYEPGSTQLVIRFNLDIFIISGVKPAV
jgi:hypothetical protein